MKTHQERFQSGVKSLAFVGCLMRTFSEYSASTAYSSRCAFLQVFSHLALTGCSEMKALCRKPRVLGTRRFFSPAQQPHGNCDQKQKQQIFPFSGHCFSLLGRSPYLLMFATKLGVKNSSETLVLFPKTFLRNCSWNVGVVQRDFLERCCPCGFSQIYQDSMKRRDFITASTLGNFFLGMITWGVVTPARSCSLAQFLRPGTRCGFSEA